MIVAGLANLLGLARRSEAGQSYNITDRAFWGLLAQQSASSSGINVTRDKALSDAAFWRGINLISLDVAKAPIDVFRRRGDNKERATEHPAYQLLRYEPNEYMTAIQFVRTLQAHADVCGYGCAYIERDQELRPVSLLPLNPDKTLPERKNGEHYYRHLLNNGTEVRLQARDVLFIPGLSWDGVVPLSTIAYARDVLGLSLAAREYAARFFANDATPGMALKCPTKLSDATYRRLKESVEAMAGAAKSHRPRILEEGMDLVQYTKTAKDSQLDEARIHQIREVASVLGVPSHKLGDPNRTSYNSLEQDELNYQNQTLDGRWRVWEQECRFKLLSEKERAKDSYVIEFNRNSLVRADIGARFAAYKTALDAGIMSIDEVRSRENMNPLPDGIGEIHLVPLNMTPLQTYADDMEEPEPEPVALPAPAVLPAPPVADAEPEEAARAVLSDARFRLMRRVAEQARREAKKGGKRYMRWASEIMAAEMREIVVQAMGPGLRVLAAVTKRPADVAAEADAWLVAVERTLLEAADCMESELLQHVEEAAKRLENGEKEVENEQKQGN